MAVDRGVVERLLVELEQTVTTLRRLKGVTLKELESSPDRAWAVEHGLQVAIQSLLDVGNHILAAEGANSVEEYADIFSGLAERKVLPPDFAQRIRGMAGFRNLLVHGYARVDLARVHEFLQTRLGDFEAFAKYIVRYLDSSR
ncbi:MAG: type VII toxin-antitoxin system HepT family RNase toxin [Acidithiobacillales bacterium]